MIAMSKFEMIEYLKDYANLQFLINRYPDKQIGALFDSYMLSSGRVECDNREYYDRMRRVYMIYMVMKKYSYLEDFLLNRDNYINNNDLVDIIPSNTYSTNLNGLTNKKLLQLIRDGFNHNNDIDEIDRFKISPNGKNIEIEFLNIKRSDGSVEPIKMKFGALQMLELYNEMTNKRQNSLNISFEIPDDFDINSNNLYSELDKVRFVHYYFNNKMEKSTVEQFNRFNDTDGLSTEEVDKLSNDFNELSSSIGDTYKFELTDEQKSKIVENINKYKKFNPDMLKTEINGVLFYFLINVTPIPSLKDRLLDNQIFYCERFMEDLNESNRQTLGEIYQMLKNKNPFDQNDSFDQETFKFFNSRKVAENMSLFRDLLDDEVTVGIPIITYIDAVVTHCCKNDEVIKIGKNEFSAEKIRNSFAHGRWYITTNNSIALFDADPRNINDYNLDYIGKIDIELFKEWADSYIEHNKNRIDVRKGSNR